MPTFKHLAAAGPTFVREFIQGCSAPTRSTWCVGSSGAEVHSCCPSFDRPNGSPLAQFTIRLWGACGAAQGAGAARGRPRKYGRAHLLAAFETYVRTTEIRRCRTMGVSCAYSGDFDRLFRPNVTEDSAGSAL
jgi:hypothetical protein